MGTSFMNMPQTSLAKNWPENTTASLNELAARYSIPREEITSFHDFIRVYPYNTTIIREGDLDKSLYLIRAGSVGIYRAVDNKQEQIDTIEAVNFVGEMSLINDEPRSATVKVLSGEVVIYAIARPNVNLILSNPKWAELLISRLSKNLARKNAQMVAMSTNIHQLHGEIDQLNRELEAQRSLNQQTIQQAQHALDAILRFQTVTRDLAIVGSKGWAYLKALNDFTKAIVTHYLPGSTISEKTADVKVILKCLAAIRNGETNTIFEDLFHGLS